MKRQHLLSFFLFFTLFSGLSRAQNPLGSANSLQGNVSAQLAHKCGAMQHLEMLKQQNPGLEQQMQQNEEAAQKWIQTQYDPSERVVYTIPVVFHVVYNTAGENLSDSRLMEQLDVLNKDFRKLNSDVSNVPSAWTSITADCEINFCLATVDPSGNPTTGITRTSTSTTSFSTNDAVKYNSQGGKDAWDRNRYLNLWVCDLGGGLLGYAQFPGGPAATDGVVIDYAYTGKTGATAPYNLGRTATHEVGHWLNLYHIWGDDGTSCSGSDAVSDTPNQAGEHYGCYTPGQVLTDACTPSAPGVMWMNYMDYTDDACMYMFTNGQKARIQSCMAGSRNSLATSNGCSGSSTVVANFTANATSVCVGNSVTFTDQSFGSPNSWNWNFGGGGTPNTSTQQNPTIVFNTPGTYTVTLIASNGTTTDTMVQTAYITVSGATVGQALPFQETFESNSFTTNNWTILNPDASTTWAIVTTTGTTPGSKSAKMDYYNYNAIGERDAMVTPALNLSGYSAASLSFEHAYRRYNSGSNDSLIIYISTTCGVWTRLLSLGENGSYAFATGTNTTANWTPSGSNQWCMGAGNAPCYTINLTPYIGNNSVKFKFEGYCDYGNNLYVDNINITGTVVAPVANFSASSTAVCAGSSVTFTDLSTNNPTSWAWNFGGGGTPATSTSQNPTVTFNTPGNYTITLTSTNAGGNDAEVKNNYITVYANPSASPNVTNATCGNSNGQVAANASGGTPGYTYSWSNGASTSSISGLAPGTYTVTVSDTHSCTVTGSGTVSNIAGPTATISGTTPSACSGSTGSATVTASGGGGGYTYNWSSGATTATANNLGAGTYTVTVTDANSCTATATATVNNLNGPSVSITPVVNTSCAQNNGSLTAAASAGTPGYSYAWSNGGNTSTISGLSPGTYTVTVTDGANCQTVTSGTVGSSSAPVASIASSSDEYCSQNNGSATATATGGTGGYAYSWSNGANTATASNLAAGTYTVTVTDGASCTSTATVTINAVSGPSASITNSSNATCSQNNGSATAAGTGGSGSYSYSWSNGGNTATISNLGAGTYTVTVTDGNNCTATTSVTITATNAPIVTTTPSAVNCYGGNTGGVSTSVTNGSGNYSYSWSNGATSANLSGVAAGTYTVTVTDNTTGCTVISSATVNQPSQISVNVTSTPISSPGANDGTATANTSGGTPGYTYSWSNGGTTQTISNLGPGVYTVTVTDSKGCVKTGSVTILEATAITAASVTYFDIFPNPSQGNVTLNWEMPAGAELKIKVTNTLGQGVYGEQFTAAPSGRHEIHLGNVAKGVYILQVSSENFSQVIRLMVD